MIEPLERRELLASVVYPSSSATVSDINAWSGSQTFTVRYTSTLQVRRSTLDSRDITVTGPNGYSRLGKLYWIDKPTDNKRLYARYKISAPNGFWSNADNGEYSIFVNKGQVRDTANNPTRLKLLSTFTINVPAYPTDVAPPARTPGTAIDVSTFGAIPGDGLDDADAIQDAIDSLPLAAGVPNGISPIGGYISFGAGEYTLSHSLRITSGMWLRGVGNDTVLHSTSTVADDTAIFVYSAYGHGGIAGTRVQNLRILTDAARGIQVDPNITSDLNNLRLESLTISSGNIAIDFRSVDAYQSQIQNVTVENPGGAALWLRIGANNSAINGIKNFTVRGTARAGFDSTDPLVSLGGPMTVEGISVEDIGLPVVPLYALDVRASFAGVSVKTATANLINGELMRLERSWIRFDRIEGISSTRQLRLISTKDAFFAQASVAAGSTLASSTLIDSASHITVAALYAAGGVGTPEPGRVTVRQISSATLPAAAPLAAPKEGAPASNVFADVTDFGAFGNDPVEDTAAIQAAIDSLPSGDGIPGGDSTVGGTVLFPTGTFITTAPLRIPSGVWIVGNAWGTTIRNISGDSSSAAFQFVGNPITGFNIGAGLVNLGIHTTNAATVRADSSVTGGLIDLRLTNLAVAAGNVGIDLQNVRVYHARFDTLLMRDPVGVSLWLGDDYSGDNRVSGLQVIGNDLSGSQTLKAHVVLIGQTTLEQSWIELQGTTQLPLYVSGDITLRGQWCEDHSATLPEDVIITFENVRKAEIDVMLLVDDIHKLKFRNATGVQIWNLDIAGRTPPLSYSLDLDSGSRINIETVNAIYDVGMLDDPRLTIGGAYNKTGAIYTDTRTALTGANLLADPNITDVGSTSANDWWITMGDNLGAIEGSYSVEQTASGPRLKVVVTANPNNRRVGVAIRLAIPQTAYGKQAVIHYRVDGPEPTIVWGENFNYQYVSRVGGSLTAASTAIPISANTEMIMLLPSAVGTYYISQVGLIANS